MNLLVLGLIGSALAGGIQAAPVHVRASVEPATVGVGDPSSYVVEARFDADAVEGSSVRVFADTGSFAPVAAARTTRRRDGGTVVVRLEQRIACLDLACAPTSESRRVSLPPATVTARLAGGRASLTRAGPAVLAVEPRVASAAVRASAPPFLQETELPPERDLVRSLPGFLAAAALALALAAVVLALLALRPRMSTRSREATFARAVRLLRESAGRSTPDRRRAADLVARVAESAGERPIADDAARLAWSAAPPEPEAAVALADRAETTGR